MSKAPLGRPVVAVGTCPCGGGCYSEGDVGMAYYYPGEYPEYHVEGDFDDMWLDVADFHEQWAFLKSETDKEYEDMFV